MKTLINDNHLLKTEEGAIGILYRAMLAKPENQFSLPAAPPRTDKGAQSKSSSVIRILELLGFAALTLVIQGCATTGAVRSLTVYEDLKPQTNASSGELISIGTYNLHGLADLEGLALTLGALTNIDVWAFQEVKMVEDDVSGPIVALQESAPPEGLRKILPGESWQIYCVPVNRVGKGVWEGQAIASRYALTNQAVWELRHTGPKERAALACEVLIGTNSSISVINTDHEVAFCSITPTDRQKQVDDLIMKIGPIPGPYTNSIVLLGDFNTIGTPWQFWRKTSRTEICRLRKSLGKIALEPLPESEVPYLTAHNYGFSRALDHIFLRNAHCCRWGSTTHRRGSDHKPLWTTIRTNR